MITFVDGPAKGVQLELARTPIVLRVVRGRVWDALDQVDDVVRAGEQVFVYRLVGEASVYHISCRPRSRSRWVYKAKYEFLDPQPAFDQIRTTAAWRQWCETVRDAMMEAWKASCSPQEACDGHQD